MFNHPHLPNSGQDGLTCGAGNGIWTRDHKLGKLVLYQLSYARSAAKNPEIQAGFRKTGCLIYQNKF